ncbi:hypothetical protein ABZ860_26110 [Microbispora sp. NPDC046973]|uniref:hypothetical protein n=1 Tax=Microbispora sp. NPDC046973 TaxID=3155022 RepID=UPI0033F6EFD5
MLDGTMSVAPRQRFGVVDVRDVADPHIRAMAAPEILGRWLGPLAARVPTREAPGDEPPRPITHNDRARDELGWRPRPAETTIVQTAESLLDLGLVTTQR